MICKVTKNCRDSCTGPCYAPKFIARRGLRPAPRLRTPHHRRPAVSARAPPSRTPDQGESSDRPRLRTATARQRPCMKSARTTTTGAAQRVTRTRPSRSDTTKPPVDGRSRPPPQRSGHRIPRRAGRTATPRAPTLPASCGQTPFPNKQNRLRQHPTFDPRRPRHPQTEEVPFAFPETTRPRRTDATGARSHKTAKNPAGAFIPPRARLPGASLSVHFPATRFQRIFHQRDDRHRPDSARDLSLIHISEPTRH